MPDRLDHAAPGTTAPKYLDDPSEAARLLKLDEAALLEAAERGELPARRVAGECRFSHAAVLAWLDPGRSPTPA